MDGVRANQAQECSFTGARWATDPNAHKSFCESSIKAGNEAIVISEDQGRAKDLVACGNACENYRDNAVSAAKDAITNRCSGLTGPRYSTDPNAHMQFCLGSKRAGNFQVIKSEETARNVAIDQCLHK